MFEIQGQFASAKVYAKTLDQETMSQVMTLCNQEFLSGSSIAIMPDAHAGKGCTIGTTLTITDRISPSLVGVDIGCGMLVTVLNVEHLDLNQLDRHMHQAIPSGRRVHDKPALDAGDFSGTLKQLRCYKALKKNENYYLASLGTLGGGNHFCEVDIDELGFKYLVFHSGSRNLGLQIANHYQEIAFHECGDQSARCQAEIQLAINSLKGTGNESAIGDAIKAVKAKYKRQGPINKDLCYVLGPSFDDYIHDMHIAQEYASLNRHIMTEILLDKCKLEKAAIRQFETIHNYIDMKTMVLRKGAIDASAGKELIIPLNMRDGCIIGTGKGNPEWNSSGPHGAGRLMSRSQAKGSLTLTDFKAAMEGIYTTSVSRDTLDEAPMAYKPAEEILDTIGDSINIDSVVKPIYNFKASE